jgi:hypothetical protein
MFKQKKIALLVDERPESYSFCQGRQDRDVPYGSGTDICSAKWHVRFTPNSDRESGLQKTMSALPLEADICIAQAHVCYGPKADIQPLRPRALICCFGR